MGAVRVGRRDRVLRTGVHQVPGVLLEASARADRRRDARRASSVQLRRRHDGHERRRSVRASVRLRHTAPASGDQRSREPLGREHPGDGERHQRRHQDTQVQQLGDPGRPTAAHLVLVVSGVRRCRGEPARLRLSVRLCREVTGNSSKQKIVVIFFRVFFVMLFTYSY